MQIQIQNLSHTYNNRSSSIAALNPISLQIPAGEFVAIIGPSGCGKSTLLRILAGLLTPTLGSARLDQQTSSRAAAGKKIGWMSQSPALLPWKTVRQNIELAGKINPQANNGYQPAAELLELIHMQEFSEAYPHTLSGGMQQRVALARTLACNPTLWLMDEPFAALDELTRAALSEDVLRLWQTFKPTVLWVTHHIFESVRLANRVLVMSPRPGIIAADIAIDLPRPRRDSNRRFHAHIREIRHALGLKS